VNHYSGPPATLGSTAAAQARLIVWCRDCRHQVEPDPAALARHYGANLSVPDWAKRLVCSACGSHEDRFRRHRRQALINGTSAATTRGAR
jgi:hypothetical protein